MAKSMEWIKLPIGLEEVESAEDGTVIIQRVVGRMVCLARWNKKWKAVNNNCPHAGGSLGMGFLDEKGDIVCPLHRYKFDMETGRNSSGQGFYVEPYPIESREDGLYIGFPKKRWFL